MTHSLVVGALAAVAAWLWRVRGTRFPPAIVGGLSLAVFGGLVTVAAVIDGPVAASVMAVFAAAVLGVTVAAERWALDARTVLAAALLGLLTHPFGDLLTGEPPALLYPLDVPVLADRVALSPDPTLHLLGAFAVELAVVWVALLVALSLTGRRVRGHLSGRAALGVGYAGAALVLPAPTLGTSYHFVFSVLAVGVVGTVRVGPTPTPAPAPGRGPGPGPGPGLARAFTLPGSGRIGPGMDGWRAWLRAAASARLADPWTAAVTGLSAVSLAWLAYTATYLLA